VYGASVGAESHGQSVLDCNITLTGGPLQRQGGGLAAESGLGGAEAEAGSYSGGCHVFVLILLWPSVGISLGLPGFPGSSSVIAGRLAGIAGLGGMPRKVSGSLALGTSRG
jgi:hypothetical protein